MKVKELLEYGKNNLIEKEEPYRLSKILLKHLLKVEDSYLIINNEKDVEAEICEIFKKDITVLKQGKPIQYITNKQEFMRLDFYVDENVLIPQPDTEILVEEVINLLKNKKKEILVLDLCTGSGAIGISIAKNVSNAKVYLSDISEKALEIARKNAIQNEVESKCNFIQSDMFENINNKFDIIVSNPPYIKSEVISSLDKEVQNEPNIALDGGEDGLEFYKKISEDAYKYLNEDGILALEIGYDQREDVIKLLEKTEKYRNIYSKQDLGENDRIIVCNI